MPDLSSARRLFAVALLLGAAACSRPGVVIYCAADQDFAEPILNDVEASLGVKIEKVFDIEAAKTVGLVRTLIEEKSRPRCDVFWNNEIVHTLRLASQGILTPYKSPAADAIPAKFKDPAGMWTGMAARARVLIVNTTRVKAEDFPKSIRDLADPKWKGRVGVARPLAGTTLTHFECLMEAWGDADAQKFFDALLANGVNLAAGNGPVARLVAEGELDFGLTDSDDFEVQRQRGKPVAVVYPDAETTGTVVLPNTVALIAGGPNPENGKRLVDALLAPDIERRLAASASANIPVRDAVQAPAHVKRLTQFRVLDVSFADVAKRYDVRFEVLKTLFLR
jgi:iron(III) transport system substrate-binding protein